jgi:hypothetical protein
MDKKRASLTAEGLKSRDIASIRAKAARSSAQSACAAFILPPTYKSAA